MNIERGTVVLVDLDPTAGHEQRGARPCIVVSNPEVTEHQRYPLLCVIRITGTPGEGPHYPPLAPGASGLRKPSFALVDQLRSVDKRRVRRWFGRIARSEMEAVDRGICLYLGVGLG